MDKFEVARQKYKPEKIKVLFIAESIPKEEDNRFFYFEDVQKGDSLFIEMVKHLYPETKEFSPKVIRKGKAILLKQFQQDGYYLMDSVTKSISGLSSSQKKKAIFNEREMLVSRLRNQVSENAKIVLITTTVFEILYEYLTYKGFNIVHNESIPFAGFGNQAKFHQQLEKFGL